MGAQILPATLTELTCSTGGLKPGNTHTISFLEKRDSWSNLIHDADGFMPWNDGTSHRRQFPFDNMKVGSTDSAHMNLYPNLSGSWEGNLDVTNLQRVGSDIAIVFE
jgi:hypothetical protein